MKKFVRVRSAVFLIVILLISAAVSSCKEDDGAGYTFKMNIENNPRNLDPQMTEDRESVMIITNMMEGLVKELPGGAIVPAAAESFEMSEDGLTYTFHLRQDREWTSQADFSKPVTADDFVFAFRRIFDPATNSPYRGDYMCILNASGVLNGSKDPELLGVRASDEYTVRFILEYPYYDFLSLLTKTAAMPCCREFFELSKGRYGMAADAAASNGAFYLKEWNFDPYWDNNYIIMRRNASYSENSRVYPYGLNFFITGDSSNDRADFSSVDINCFITGEADERLFSESVVYSENIKTAGLVFDLDSPYFKNKAVREALAKSLNRDAYSHILPDNLTPAFGIIPSGITLQGKSYRDIVPDRTLSVYDAGSAELWENALRSAGIESVDGAKITVCEDFSGIDMLYDITDRWRSELLFNCGVEIVSQNEYDSKIEAGEYVIALAELDSEHNSAFEFMSAFTEREYFRKYSNPSLVADINSSMMSVSLTDGTERFSAAESAVIGDYVFIPLCYEKEYLVCDKKSADLAYYPFTGTVWFGDAKYFS
ncbi:MAG: peptide ABC transporter substrate-binding protein [Oscillospiraceae bacterium]|nr:peptide ABC transporter substrate-binding protein [Oscillospiraceae bacterium]